MVGGNDFIAFRLCALDRKQQYHCAKFSLTPLLQTSLQRKNETHRSERTSFHARSVIFAKPNEDSTATRSVSYIGNSLKPDIPYLPSRSNRIYTRTRQKYATGLRVFVCESCGSAPTFASACKTDRSTIRVMHFSCFLPPPTVRTRPESATNSC